MIVVLLIIIAIGVLLCSEPGKRILGGGVSLLLLGAMLLLVIGGGWLIIANFKELSITALCLIVLGFFIAGIVWAFNWLERQIRRIGRYPEYDGLLPWYKPEPSAIIISLIILMGVVSYFVVLDMIKNHSL